LRLQTEESIIVLVNTAWYWIRSRQFEQYLMR
jgi:hypothetical protein